MPTNPLPEIFISKELVNSRVSNYLANKYPLLIDQQQKIAEERTETKSIWYSKDHIQTWLDEIALLNADGMRIYFGGYNEDESPVSGQLCLIMVLTRQTENGRADIIYEDEPGFEDRLNAASKARDIGDPENEMPRQFNYGAPCPPIC